MAKHIQIAHIPEAKLAVLYELVDELQRVPGVVAVVLGGSYASGAAHEQSDLDVGIYYDPETPFEVATIREIAQQIALEDTTPTVTDLYAWGAWVNGGAWIQSCAGKVDFLYRNLEQVQRTITDAKQGITHHDFGQQPTYGFYSVIYLAETQICIPLYDPDGVIADLKVQVTPYPPMLKATLIGDHLWSAEFTLVHARHFAAQGDVYNTAGCLTRIATNLTQALFALNERYFMRDKQVMKTIEGFPILPAGYVEAVTQVLACPGGTAGALTASVHTLEDVWRAVVALAGGRYVAKFEV